MMGQLKAGGEKNGNLKQLMGVIKSFETGKTEIISEADWNNLTKKS